MRYLYLFLGLLIAASTVFFILWLASDDEFERHYNLKKAIALGKGFLSFAVLFALFEFFNIPFKEEINNGMRYIGIAIIDLSLGLSVMYFAMGVWNLLKKNSYKYIVNSGISLVVIGVTFTIYKLAGLF